MRRLMHRLGRIPTRRSRPLRYDLGPRNEGLNHKLRWVRNPGRLTNLILNLIVDNEWEHSEDSVLRDEDTVSQLEIDNIRVYQQQ